MTDDELDALLRSMDEVAITARLSSAPAMLVSDCGASVTAETASEPHAIHGITYPPYLEPDGWRRIGETLTKKARKYAAADAIWLRLDLLDGTHAFSPWAQDDPCTQLRTLADAVTGQVSSYSAIAGVVVSSGAIGLDTATDDDPVTVVCEAATRISRPLPFFRRRVTYVVPLRDGHHGADTFVSMYEHEHEWLPGALGRAGLPDRTSLLR